MTLNLYRAADARTLAPSSWQRVLFSEFEATLTSKERPFPCIYGVAGLKSDQLRFAFPDPLTPETLAPILEGYLEEAPGLGKMTSLVIFGRPGPVQGLDDYKSRFWSLLDGLARLDRQPWPEEIPQDLDTDGWEFCFAGEPIFVVCNSPAHVLRQSRRSTSFMLTFQPRWVFDGIMDDAKPAAARALEEVRSRLADFDALPPSPTLGKYGAPGNREYQQYFLDDENTAPACPFHRMAAGASFDTKKGKVA